MVHTKIHIIEQHSASTSNKGKFVRANPSNGAIEFAEVTGGGGGDMFKSTYDTDNSGIVDNSEKLEGSTKAQVQDHDPKAHTLGSHSTKAHSELTGVTATQHHSNADDHDHDNKTLLDTYFQTEANLADAVSKKHSNTLDHDGDAQNTVIAGKTTLVAVKEDTDIADAITKKHANTLDHSNSLDHSNTLDHSHSNKGQLDLLTDGDHDVSSHAPSDAQKNSDITKAEIEAKLTGEISSHSHAGGGGLGYTINVQALTSSPADGATIYFGMLPKAPTTTANISKVYIRKAGTIKIAEIYCYSGTAGTNEAWSLYIRKNNTTDTLIATLSVNTSGRVFSNTALNIAVAVGDYIEIKGVQPTWATNPLTTIYGGYIYIE